MSRSGWLQRLRDYYRHRHHDDPAGLSLHRRRIYILPTRAGMGYLLAVGLVLIAAINYANSLAYGMAFLMISLGINTMWHTHQCLNHLHVQLRSIEPCFAGDNALLEVWARSKGPVGQLSVRCNLDEQIKALNPGVATRFDVLNHQAIRGEQPVPLIEVSSDYPLGIFRAWAWLNFRARILVYPRPVDHLGRDPERSGNSLDRGNSLRRGEEDFAGLKNFQPGDSLSRIHWKSVGRGQNWQSKDFDLPQGSEIILDWHDVDLPVEQRLQQLSYWLLQFEKDGSEYGLNLPQQQIALGHGESHLHKCLEALARFPHTSGDTRHV